MTFEQLKCFVTLSEFMNFTMAANALYMSQPTFSRNIKNLEDNLGVQLVIRTTQHIELTLEGQYLVSRAKTILREKEEIEEDIWKMNSGITGHLSIKSIPSQSPEVYSLCHDFSVAYPTVMLDLQRTQYGTSVQEILSGAADVCISCSYEIDDYLNSHHGEPPFHSMPLSKSEFMIIIADANPLSKRESLSAQDICNENILLALNPAPTTFCSRIHAHLGAHIHAKMLNRPNNLEEMAMQVSAGLGIALLPKSLCRKNFGYSAVKIADLDTTFEITMIWGKNNNNPALKSFLQIATQYSQDSLCE